MFQKTLCSFGVALALVSACGQAMAATVTVDKTLTAGEQYQLTASTASILFEPDALNLMSLTNIDFASIAPAIFNESTSAVALSSQSFTYNDANNQVTSLSTLGGLTFSKSTLFKKNSISFQDLTFNFTNYTISARASGTNGLVTARQDVFSFYPVSTTTLNGAGTRTFNAKDLILTEAGVAAMTQALGLTESGTNLLASVYLGSIAASITVASTVTPAPIPEPASYALMGLGLVAISFATKRRLANQ